MVFLIPIGPLMLWLQNPYAGWSCALSAVLLSANILMWRKGLSLVWVHAIYQTTLMVLIFFNAAFTYGVGSSMLVFMGVVPILPVFSVGRLWAVFWVLVSFVFLAILFTLQVMGYIPMHPGEDWRNLMQSADTANCLVASTRLAHFFVPDFPVVLSAIRGRSGVPGVTAMRVPLYSMPHLSFTITCLSIRSIRKGFGFTGIGCAVY